MDGGARLAGCGGGEDGGYSDGRQCELPAENQGEGGSEPQRKREQRSIEVRGRKR